MYWYWNADEKKKNSSTIVAYCPILGATISIRIGSDSVVPMFLPWQFLTFGTRDCFVDRWLNLRRLVYGAGSDRHDRRLCLWILLLLSFC